MNKGFRSAQSTRDRVRRWWPWIALSIVVHLPLTPIGSLLGLLTLLLRLESSVRDEPIEELVGIPVELLASEQTAEPALETTSSEGKDLGKPAPVLAPKKPKPPRKPKTEHDKREPLDAGVSDAEVATPPDAALDAAVASNDRAIDGGLSADLPDGGVPRDDAGMSDAGVAPRRPPDPFAIAGDLTRLQQSNVNVRINLFTEPLRHHPAGGVIASLLLRDPQWQEFIGPGTLDLLNDLHKVVIMGPQLVDSSQVAALIEGDAKAIRSAIDAIVKRTEGAHWETKNKKSIAYVRVAGADRVFVVFPGGGVAIVPPKPADQIISLTKFPAVATNSGGGEILQLMLKTPHRVRAFKRAGVEVPISISLAKLFITGTANGGAQVRLELEDSSAEAAAQHAPELERDLARVGMGLLSVRLRVEGAQIFGEATLSPLVVGAILREVQKRFLPKTEHP